MVTTAVRILAGVCCGIGAHAAALDRMGQRFLAEIEGADFMARLGEIGRHSPAHMPQPDECDFHGINPYSPTAA